MKWSQAVAPNLDPVIYQGGIALSDWLGYCLAFAQTAFGAGWAGSTAWEAWTSRVTYKHADLDIPRGVYVPIWFDGWWAGGRYGHVAIYKDGAVWSSPYTHKPYADNLGSIAEVERIYGMTYVGWSEDIGGTRVIEQLKKEDLLTPEAVQFAYRLGWNREPDQNEYKYWTGKPSADLLMAIYWSNHDFRSKAVTFDALKAQSNALAKRVEELSKRPTQSQLDELNKQVARFKAVAEQSDLIALSEKKKAEEIEVKAEKLQANADADKLAGETAIRRLGQFIQQYLPGWLGGSK